MTTSSTTSAVSNSPAVPSLAAASMMKPMLLWLAIQLAALAIGAAGLGLSNRRQTPPEILAIDVMLAVQIATAALLWPILMVDWRAGVAVCVASLPFVQAAGFISATPTSDLLPAAGTMLLWLITLAVLPRRAASPTFMSALRMTTALWSIGGALLTYLVAEFSFADTTAKFGPLAQSIGRLHDSTASISWKAGSVVLIGTIVLRAVVAKKKSNNR